MPYLFVKSDDCQQISAKIHNRKCKLLVRLERAKTPTKLLFVEFKAVLYVKVWCRDKKKTFLLRCSSKVGGKWLCSRTYSGITRNRPARLGLLYLFIVGGQCHTRPLMHVAGVLGCWPALCAGLLCCNFFDMLTPVPFYHFFSSLILLFIYV